MSETTNETAITLGSPTRVTEATPSPAAAEETFLSLKREKSVQMDVDRKSAQKQQEAERGQLVLDWISQVVGEDLPSGKSLAHQ